MPVISILKLSGTGLAAIALISSQSAACAELPAGDSYQDSLPQADKQSSAERVPETLKAIAELEKKYFEHDFRSETADERLLRLEQLLFGDGRSGDSRDRLLTLQNLAATPEEIAASAPLEDRLLYQMEQRFFSRAYTAESIEARLARLEKLAYGSERTGDCKSRLKSLCSTFGLNADPSGSTESAAGKEAHSAISTKTADSFAREMDEGIKNFNYRRYNHAQENFEKAISLNSRSAEAYANLGGTLLMLRDRQGAESAFKACYSLNPFGKLGSYAKDQILSLAREIAYQKTEPQDSPATVSKAIQEINRQCADRTQLYQKQANGRAEYRLRLADIEVQKINAETTQAIADLRAASRQYTYSHRGRRHSQNSYVNPMDIEEISNLAYIQSDYQRSDGQVQANLAITDAYKRSLSVYESGNNLKDQLLQKASPGEPKLRALGSNLYVRYYGNDTASSDEQPSVDPQPAQLAASPERLRSH